MLVANFSLSASRGREFLNFHWGGVGGRKKQDASVLLLIEFEQTCGNRTRDDDFGLEEDGFEEDVGKNEGGEAQALA